jgi:hypothetical protein
MREVNQIDNAVNHGVAKRYQGIHAAQYQSVDDLLQQDIDIDSPKRWAIVGKKKPSTAGGLAI